MPLSICPNCSSYGQGVDGTDWCPSCVEETLLDQAFEMDCFEVGPETFSI